MKEKIKNVEEIKFKFNINIKKDRFDEPKRSSCLFRRHTDKRENAALRSRL